MKCREKQLISDFAEVEEGKHIEMRGGIRCCNNRALYSHHAIVDSVQPLENGMSTIKRLDFLSIMPAMTHLQFFFFTKCLCPKKGNDS